MQFSKKEITHLIIAVVIAAFIFSFKEWGYETFSLKIGIVNFIRALLICTLIFPLRSLAQKFLAEKYDCSSNFTLPYINSKTEITKYFGPLTTIIITLISNGKFLLPILSSFDLKISKTTRTGRKWSNIREFEIGKIGLMGPLTDVILLTMFKILLPLSSFFFTKAMFIASSLAIFNMLPLPKLDGERIFFGSKYLYLFAVVFIIAYIALIYIISIKYALILATFMALIILIKFFSKTLD